MWKNGQTVLVIFFALVVGSQCNCPSNQFKSAKGNICVAKVTAGGSCQHNWQCAKGLVCSTTGSFQGVCLRGLGGTCSSDNDCANLLFCGDSGECTCEFGEDTFETSENKQSCIISPQNPSYNAKKCKTNADCSVNGKTDSYCDNQAGGNMTGTCLFGLGDACLEFSDCANALVCDNNHFCACSDGEYYDEIQGNCFAFKLYTEACTADLQCSEDLQCDLGVVSTSGLSRHTKTCLKSFEANCENNNDCVNGLGCYNQTCNCPSGTYYEPIVRDCLPQATFGAPCLSQNSCGMSASVQLICDLDPAGTLTKTCLRQAGGACANSDECANNLSCSATTGTCACTGTLSWNATLGVCK